MGPALDAKVYDAAQVLPIHLQVLIERRGGDGKDTAVVG